MQEIRDVARDNNKSLIFSFLPAAAVSSYSFPLSLVAQHFFLYTEQVVVEVEPFFLAVADLHVQVVLQLLSFPDAE